MLVLSRKAGEKVHIGDGIVVTIVQLSGNRVRLGVQAPPSIPILRGELAEWLEPSNPDVASAEKEQADIESAS
jgi:carbon storage regulator